MCPELSDLCSQGRLCWLAERLGQGEIRQSNPWKALETHATHAFETLSESETTMRDRAQMMLIEADLQLKRSHSHESRGRFVIEKLFLRLAKELKPAA